MIRGGAPQKYKPTKSSELPKPRKSRPTKITNRTVIICITTKSHHLHSMLTQYQIYWTPTVHSILVCSENPVYFTEGIMLRFVFISIYKWSGLPKYFQQSYRLALESFIIYCSICFRISNI